jgi:hypothetical protein
VRHPRPSSQPANESSGKAQLMPVKAHVDVYAASRCVPPRQRRLFERPPAQARCRFSDLRPFRDRGSDRHRAGERTGLWCARCLPGKAPTDCSSGNTSRYGRLMLHRASREAPYARVSWMPSRTSTSMMMRREQVCEVNHRWVLRLPRTATSRKPRPLSSVCISATRRPRLMPHQPCST